MLAWNANRALTRRVSEQFLLFGLAGLFLFLLTAIYLSWHNQFLNFMTAAVVLPLGLLFFGSMTLRHVSQCHDEIETQLHLMAQSPNEISELRPIASNAKLAKGWNLLLEKVQQHQAWNGVERRLSEAIHARQSRRWEAIFQNLPEGVATCDETGVVQQCNRALASLMGFPSVEDVQGKKLLELLEDLVGEEAREKLQGLAVSNAGQTLELKRSTEVSDGVWRLSTRVVDELNTSSPCSLWTLRDITQTKLAEQAREQFVFTATHELRTPLANIRAYTETLATATDIPIETQNSFYNTINSEASRLSRFVDELLNVSQMEAGAITIQKHEVHLERLLLEVIESQKPLATEKHQKFEHSLSPKLPRIHADKDKLSAALTNLIGNAIKYTPDHGRVHVRVESDNDRVEFHVEDSGIGIAAEDIPKLGTKFFRSHDSRVQERVGSGLGLAFAQEVARLHGGAIAITSQINQGSCFTLELPLR